MVYTVGEMARLETFQHQRPPKNMRDDDLPEEFRAIRQELKNAPIG